MATTTNQENIERSNDIMDVFGSILNETHTSSPDSSLSGVASNIEAKGLHTSVVQSMDSMNQFSKTLELLNRSVNQGGRGVNSSFNDIISNLREHATSLYGGGQQVKKSVDSFTSVLSGSTTKDGKGGLKIDKENWADIDRSNRYASRTIRLGAAATNMTDEYHRDISRGMGESQAAASLFQKMQALSTSLGNNIGQAERILGGRDDQSGKGGGFSDGRRGQGGDPAAHSWTRQLVNTVDNVISSAMYPAIEQFVMKPMQTGMMSAEVMPGFIPSAALIQKPFGTVSGYLNQMGGDVQMIETEKKALKAVTGSTDASEKMVEHAVKIARTEPIEFGTAIQAFRSFSVFPGTKEQVKGDSGFREELLEVIQRLAILTPEQGEQGAMFALRELLSGQEKSLQRRFNIDMPTILNAAGRSDMTKGEFLGESGEGMIRILSKAMKRITGESALVEKSLTTTIQTNDLKDTMMQAFALPMTSRGHSMLSQGQQEKYEKVLYERNTKTFKGSMSDDDMKSRASKEAEIAASSPVGAMASGFRQFNYLLNKTLDNTGIGNVITNSIGANIINPLHNAVSNPELEGTTSEFTKVISTLSRGVGKVADDLARNTDIKEAMTAMTTAAIDVVSKVAAPAAARGLALGTGAMVNNLLSPQGLTAALTGGIDSGGMGGGVSPMMGMMIPAALYGSAFISSKLPNTRNEKYNFNPDTGIFNINSTYVDEKGRTRANLPETRELGDFTPIGGRDKKGQQRSAMGLRANAAQIFGDQFHKEWNLPVLAMGGASMMAGMKGLSEGGTPGEMGMSAFEMGLGGLMLRSAIPESTSRQYGAWSNKNKAEFGLGFDQLKVRAVSRLSKLPEQYLMNKLRPTIEESVPTISSTPFAHNYIYGSEGMSWTQPLGTYSPYGDQVKEPTKKSTKKSNDEFWLDLDHQQAIKENERRDKSIENRNRVRTEYAEEGIKRKAKGPYSLLPTEYTGPPLPILPVAPVIKTPTSKPPVTKLSEPPHTAESPTIKAGTSIPEPPHPAGIQIESPVFGPQQIQVKEEQAPIKKKTDSIPSTGRILGGMATSALRVAAVPTAGVMAGGFFAYTQQMSREKTINEEQKMRKESLDGNKALTDDQRKLYMGYGDEERMYSRVSMGGMAMGTIGTTLLGTPFALGGAAMTAVGFGGAAVAGVFEDKARTKQRNAMQEANSLDSMKRMFDDANERKDLSKEGDVFSLAQDIGSPIAKDPSIWKGALEAEQQIKLLTKGGNYTAWGPDKKVSKEQMEGFKEGQFDPDKIAEIFNKGKIAKQDYKGWLDPLKPVEASIQAESAKGSKDPKQEAELKKRQAGVDEYNKIGGELVTHGTMGTLVENGQGDLLVKAATDAAALKQAQTEKPKIVEEATQKTEAQEINDRLKKQNRANGLPNDEARKIEGDNKKTTTQEVSENQDAKIARLKKQADASQAELIKAGSSKDITPDSIKNTFGEIEKLGTALHKASGGALSLDKATEIASKSMVQSVGGLKSLQTSMMTEIMPQLANTHVGTWTKTLDEGGKYFGPTKNIYKTLGEDLTIDIKKYKSDPAGYVQRLKNLGEEFSNLENERSEKIVKTGSFISNNFQDSSGRYKTNWEREGTYEAEKQILQAQANVGRPGAAFRVEGNEKLDKYFTSLKDRPDKLLSEIEKYEKAGFLIDPKHKDKALEGMINQGLFNEMAHPEEHMKKVMAGSAQDWAKVTGLANRTFSVKDFKDADTADIEEIPYSMSDSKPVRVKGFDAIEIKSPRSLNKEVEKQYYEKAKEATSKGDISILKNFINDESGDIDTIIKSLGIKEPEDQMEFRKKMSTPEGVMKFARSNDALSLSLGGRESLQRVLGGNATVFMQEKMLEKGGRAVISTEGDVAKGSSRYMGELQFLDKNNEEIRDEKGRTITEQAVAEGYGERVDELGNVLESHIPQSIMAPSESRKDKAFWNKNHQLNDRGNLSENTDSRYVMEKALDLDKDKDVLRTRKGGSSGDTGVRYKESDKPNPFYKEPVSSEAGAAKRADMRGETYLGIKNPFDTTGGSTIGDNFINDTENPFMSKYFFDKTGTSTLFGKKINSSDLFDKMPDKKGDIQGDKENLKYDWDNKQWINEKVQTNPESKGETSSPDLNKKVADQQATDSLNDLANVVREVTANMAGLVIKLEKVIAA